MWTIKHHEDFEKLICSKCPADINRDYSPCAKCKRCYDFEYEKEAEEIAKDIYIHHFDDDVNYPEVLKAITVGVQKGAEFGYNKANEWYYMKDVNCYEDLHFPPEEEEKGRVLIWKVQVITEKGIKKPVCYHCGSYGDLWYEINAYHVIAWKEIILPEQAEQFLSEVEK